MILLCLLPLFTFQIAVVKQNKSTYSGKSSEKIQDTNFFLKNRYQKLTPKNLKIPNSAYTCSSSNPNSIVNGDFSNFLELDIQSGCQSIKCNDCHFSNIHIETTSTQSSVIYINNAQFSIEGNSDFTNCYSEKQIQSTSISNSICHLIFIDDQTQKVTISECTFTNCGNSNNPTGFLILSLSQQLDLSNAIFSFERTSKACPCLSIQSVCRLNVDSSKFTNSNNLDSNEGSGCISYSPIINPTAHESISIKNSNFINGAGRAFAISLSMQSTRPFLLNLDIQTTNSIQYAIAIKISSSTDDILETELNNLIFSNIQSDFPTFYYETQSENDKLIFNSCTFSNCEYTGTSPNEDDIDGGSAISITDPNCRNFDILIEECIFKDCTTSRNDGGAICIHTNKNVKIVNTQITNCKTTATTQIRGSCICVQSDDSTEVLCLDNVTIQNSISHSKYPGLYYSTFEQGLLIQNCKFINIQVESATNSVSDSSLVFAPYGIETFECLNTLFSYDTQESTNCRAIFTQCVNNVIDCCIFTNTGIIETSYGGAIYYLCTNGEDDECRIINCIFESCLAQESSAICLQLFSRVPVLFNNSFEKMTNHRYTLSIIYNYQAQDEEITIDNHQFIENANREDTSDGGGSGIWISNFHLRDFSNLLMVNFVDCFFFKNQASKAGGAYGVGSDKLVKQTELSFENCNFTENSCNHDSTNGGGALWIRTSCSASIHNCTFLGNHANVNQRSNGGAIYLSFTSGLYILQITDSVFIDNRCDGYQMSYGHAIYTAILYGTLNIDNCKFIDNGKFADESGTVIYAQSDLSVINTIVSFSDQWSFKRAQAFYVATSSPFLLHNSFVINCTNGNIPRGGAIQYIMAYNRDSGSLDIFNVTFQSNTFNGDGYELELTIDFKPRILNCTFISEFASKSVFGISFSDIDIAKSVEFYDLRFINLCEQYSHTLFALKSLSQSAYLETFTIDSCEFCSNKQFQIMGNTNLQINILNSIFQNNVNENSLLEVQSDHDILIQNCLFMNNTATPSIEGGDILTINIISAKCLTLINTSFYHENNQEYEIQYTSYVLKLCCNVIMDNVTIDSCTTSEMALLYDPSARISPFDDNSDPIDADKTIFVISNSNFLDSGDVCLYHKAVDFVFVNSTIRNCKNGLLYVIEPSFFPSDNDILQVQGCVFDNISSCACSLFGYCTVAFENNTIKNCYHEIDEPLFSIQFVNDSITSFCFRDFVFENNQVKNGNENGELSTSKLDNGEWIDRFVNGGGIGLDMKFQNEDPGIVIEFDNCYFISNHASCYGGVFAFTEEVPSTIFNFKNCQFNGNTCDRLKGSVLYLLCAKVLIENCHFEGNSKINPRSSMVFDQIAIKNEEIDRNSIVCMSSLSQKTTFLMTDCSFDSNNPGYCLFERNCNDLFLINCKFNNNVQRHLNLVVFNTIKFDKCEFIRGPRSESGIKEVSSIRISDCANECIFTDCKFNQFKTTSLFSIHAPKTIQFNGCEVQTDSNELSTGYAISCSCTQSLILSNTIIAYAGSVLLTSNSTTSEKVQFLNSEISGTESGFTLDNQIKAAFEVDNTTFSNDKYALDIHSNNFKLNALTIKNCISNDKAIFQITTNANQFVFNDFKFINNEFSHQSKYKMGGGIGFILNLNEKSSLLFNNCLFEKNKAVSTNSQIVENGGAFYYEDAYINSLDFNKCNFSLNSASGDGGAIFIRGTFSMNLLNCQFINNSANKTTTSGFSVPSDALFIDLSNSIKLENCSFSKVNRYNGNGNIQLTFAVSNPIDFVNCEFSIVNPKNPQVFLKGSSNEKLSFVGCSFTYFLIINPAEIGRAIILSESSNEFDRSNDVSNSYGNNGARILSKSGYEQGVSIDYQHIKTEFSGTITIGNSCFDTGESNIRSNSQITNVNFNSEKCSYPPIMEQMMDDLISEFNGAVINITAPPKKNISARRIVIGTAVAVAFVLVVAGLLTVIILMIRSKKRKFKAAKRQRQIEEEVETIRNANDDDMYQSFYTQENILFSIENPTEDIFYE